MNKKWWIVVAVVVVIGALVFGGWQYLGSRQQTRAEAREAMETAIVERDTLRVTLDATGSLSPQSEVSLAFASSGRIVEILVEEGQQVQAGDVLSQLDDADAHEAVDNAELQVTQAEIDLASARIEAEAGLAQANLDAAQVSYDEAVALAAMPGVQLTSARVNLAQAQDTLADAQENYDTAWDSARDWELDIKRMKNALEAERDATESALESAQYKLEIAQADYSLASAGISEENVQNSLAQVLNKQVSLESESLQLERLELALAQAQLGLESAQRALEDTVLVAPMAGTITELNVQVGEMASAGQAAVVVISDLSVLEVEINLDETDVAQVAVGQEAQVSVDAFPEAELTGEVTYIAPVAETQSGVVLYPVTVQIAPTEFPIRAGMTTDVEIISASREDALIVPLRAIDSEGAQSYITRLAGGRLERVEVELGLMTETEIEITQGLAEGDVVVVAGGVPGNMQRPPGGPMGIFGGGRGK